MLVLSRKKGERLRIEGPATIEVIRIGPNSIRLGIQADRSVGIFREELSAEPLTVEELAQINEVLDRAQRRRERDGVTGETLEEVQVSET